MPPSGRRTARPYLRVETLISIRFIAHLPSKSLDTASSQLGRGISFPLRARIRGRSSSTLPPWKPNFPLVFPQRCPALPSSAHRGDRRAGQHLLPSCSIMSPAPQSGRSARSWRQPPAKPLRCCRRDNGGQCGSFFMALLSFRGFDTPSLPAQGEQRLPSHFQHSAGRRPTDRVSLPSAFKSLWDIYPSPNGNPMLRNNNSFPYEFIEII